MIYYIRSFAERNEVWRRIGKVSVSCTYQQSDQRSWCWGRMWKKWTRNWYGSLEEEWSGPRGEQVRRSWGESIPVHERGWRTGGVRSKARGSGSCGGLSISLLALDYSTLCYSSHGNDWYLCLSFSKVSRFKWKIMHSPSHRPWRPL